jgi:hypothetical protein
MSDTGLGGVDFSFGMEQFNADLVAYFKTPEGRQGLIDMGITDSIYLTGDDKTGDGKPKPDGPVPNDPVKDAWGRTPDNPNYGVDLAAKRTDARASIKALLSKYKLDSLFDTVWGNYTSDMVDYTDTDALAMSIRETEAYKTRFAGNEARRAKGLGDLSPATYIALEDSFKKTMKSNGIPDSFYDTPEDFAQLIAGDVSVAEFNDRISYARSLVQDAPASVRNQMAELYNVSEGQLIAYYIDPAKAAPILKEQERAARIGSAAKENAGMQLTAATAEDLAKRGITDAQAAQGFGNINQMGELTQTFTGEADISQQDIISAQFGFNTDAEKKLIKRREQRLGEFKGGGSYARAGGASAGSIETSVGKAQ